MNVIDATSAALGRKAANARPLSGGCVGEVYRVELEDGDTVVVKIDTGASAALSIEGWMLDYLGERSTLPVPRVHHADDALLIMDFVETAGSLGAEGERHAADLLAALHDITADAYGLERDTLIGGLPQSNTPRESWTAFYAEHRLVNMARQAERARRIDSRLCARVEKLASRLDRHIDEPAAPSLVHGDVWSGNVLANNGRVAAFIDPAIYYADPDVELAFIDWLHCFGRAFFERYQEHRPIRDGWPERRTIYQLYPQLVHARLFGGGYVDEVDRNLSRLSV